MGFGLADVESAAPTPHVFLLLKRVLIATAAQLHSMRHRLQRAMR